MGAARPFGAVALGIGDDAAILRPRATDEIVVTTDLFLEGRHFRRDWHPAASAGHRCLARGLSDIAAMGAKPLAAFLSLAVPRSTAETPDGRRWLAEFLDGLGSLAERSRTVLAGGDTAEAPGDALIADIVLLGTVARGQALRRSSARPGDCIYVTGALGGAAAELANLADPHSSQEPSSPGGPSSRSAHRNVAAQQTTATQQRADSKHPQLYPEPRLAAGQALVRRYLATACLDVSDGLSTELYHLCAESDVGATVDAARLPIHTLALHNRTAEQALALALHGGEDYELLFTTKARTRIPRLLGGVPVTAIGEITPAGAGVLLRQADGTVDELHAGGWEHLK
jgi:thiamine-monophosphate kinase